MTAHDEVTSIGQLPGVYLIREGVTLDSVKAFASEHGFRVVVVHGDATRKKESFLREAARAMQFPGYFGVNWDAFDECVRDLSWIPASGYVMVYDDFSHFARSDPAAWNTAVAILREATEYWWQKSIPMYVLLRGHAAAAPGVPQLRVA